MSSVSFIEHILLELFGYTENDDKYINKRIGFSYIKPRIFDQTMRVYKVMCSEEKILLAIRASCIKRLRDRYLKSQVLRSIACVIRYVKCQLYRAYPARIIWIYRK